MVQPENASQGSGRFVDDEKHEIFFDAFGGSVSLSFDALVDKALRRDGRDD
jgi:hypothetical protein